MWIIDWPAPFTVPNNEPITFPTLATLAISQYEAGIAAGQFSRFPVVWALLPSVLAFVVLTLPRPMAGLRVAAGVGVFAHLAYTLLSIRSRPGVGLAIASAPMTVGSIRLIVMLLCDNPAVDFRRIVRRRVEPTDQSKLPDAAYHPIGYSYEWEGQPEQLGRRIGWVVDLLGSFRGVAWNWTIAGVGHVPERVQTQLQPKVQARNSPRFLETHNFGSAADRDWYVIYRLVRFVAVIFIGELAQVLIRADEFTYSGFDSGFPSYLSPLAKFDWISWVLKSSTIVRMWRLWVVTVYVFASFTIVSTFSQLLFVVVPELPFFLARRLDQLVPTESAVSALIRPRLIRAGVWLNDLFGVYAEPWTSPDEFILSFRPVVELGVNGFWGKNWHRAARYTFIRPSTLISELILPAGLASKLFRVAITFVTVGIVHTLITRQGGSTVVDGDSFWPFILQIPICIGQEALTYWFDSIDASMFVRAAVNVPLVVYNLGWVCWPFTRNISRHGMVLGTDALRTFGLASKLGLAEWGAGVDPLVNELVFVAPESTNWILGLSI